MIGIEQNVTIAPTINVGLYNSVQVLQSNTLDIDRKITEEIESNITLEEDDEYRNEANVDWDKFIENYTGGDNSYNPNTPKETSEFYQVLEPARTENDLDTQILCIQCSTNVRAAIDTIITYCLDEFGFLSQPIDAGVVPWADIMNKYLCNMAKFTDLPDDVQNAILKIRDLQPTGIGYRNRQESFIAQAEYIPGFPRELIDIMVHHYDMLMSLDCKGIGRILKISSDEVSSMLSKWIKQLNPNPIPEVPTAVNYEYMTPELVATVSAEGKVSVKLTRIGHCSSRVKISKTYIDMLKDKTLDNESRNFIRARLNKGQVFITNLKYRESTLSKLGKYFATTQKQWFLTGRDADIVPMSVTNVADKLELANSTISRCVNGKYIDTPYGIVELKKFVSNNTVYDDGNSAKAVVERIGELIAAEDKKNPLSDESIRIELEKSGIKVSRRVIMKYREKYLKIPSTRERRKSL